MFEATAFEVVLEFATHVVRQNAPFGSYPWRIPRLRTAHSDNSGLSNSNSAANIFANEEGSVLPNMMQVMNAITPGSQVVTSIEREVSR
jgi:hypothetical protein